jgi:hypothetical protein
MSADERRRARRAFVREHHPDRGGDSTAFIEGLARFAQDRQLGEPEIVIYRRRRFRVAGTLTWRVFGRRRHAARVR